jgi:hypothetical protein
LMTARELVIISDEKQSASGEISSETLSSAEASESANERETVQSLGEVEGVTPDEMGSGPIEKPEIDPDKLPADVYEFSEIITFIPRVRLASFQMQHQDHFCVLALQLHGMHGGTKFEINLPSEEEAAVLKTFEQWSL